jgi:hypothetical protein
LETSAAGQPGIVHQIIDGDEGWISIFPVKTCLSNNVYAGSVRGRCEIWADSNRIPRVTKDLSNLSNASTGYDSYVTIMCLIWCPVL